MTHIYDELLKPIDPIKVETLQRLYSGIGSIPIVLLGAFARDLLFHHIHGIEIPRATMDIDISVQMATWNNFRTACAELKRLGFNNDNPDHPEKFTDTNGQEVDMLPFGSLSKDGKTIIWEADDSRWTISGIQEAYDHAWIVKLENIELHVTPPCALIYLKIFSTHDRPGDRKKKDAVDIHFVLTHYLKVADEKRLRSGGIDDDIMGIENGDLVRATARLAGRDMGRMLLPQAAEELDRILGIETDGRGRCPIAHELAGFHDGQFQRARGILRSVRIGVEETRT